MTPITTIIATKDNKSAIIDVFNKANSENYTFGETPTIISKF